MAEREFTGRHAAMVFIGAFGIIIGVNIALAVSAVRTFPGLEVANSYVASQEFDARRDAQVALGWTADVIFDGQDLRLSILDTHGHPADIATLTATVGRRTEARDDFTPDFGFDGSAHVAPADLAPGRWDLRLRATARDGTAFTQRLPIRITQ
jgi:nitrogen fixation protein FixH